MWGLFLRSVFEYKSKYKSNIKEVCLRFEVYFNFNMIYMRFDHTK